MVDVNAQGPLSKTPLAMAVVHRVVGILDDSRVDANPRDRVGGSPLHLAARVRGVAVMRRFLQHEGIGFGFEWWCVWESRARSVELWAEISGLEVG